VRRGARGGLNAQRAHAMTQPVTISRMAITALRGRARVVNDCPPPADCVSPSAVRAREKLGREECESSLVDDQPRRSFAG
jgi:hypothetical protein